MLLPLQQLLPEESGYCCCCYYTADDFYVGAPVVGTGAEITADSDAHCCAFTEVVDCGAGAGFALTSGCLVVLFAHAAGVLCLELAGYGACLSCVVVTPTAIVTGVVVVMAAAVLATARLFGMIARYCPYFQSP